MSSPGEHRVMRSGPHFVLLSSCANKTGWGRPRKRIVLLEYTGNTIPNRADMRDKRIKHVIRAWHFQTASKQSFKIAVRIGLQAMVLYDKLEHIWPLHFAAKEAKGRALYMGKRNAKELKWILKVIPKLMPGSIKWLVDQGYCERIVEDGVTTIKLTEEGYKYFAYIPVKK
jgi:hypothetical protein